MKSIPEDLKLLFRRNGVLIEGQQKIVNIIERDIKDKYDLICWSGFPKYKQLEYILSLGWNNLLKSGETTRPMTLPKLVKITFDYGNNQNILKLVQNNIEYMKAQDRNKDKEYQALLDNAIKDSFQILKHWFQYKVPKWLSVINNLQQYICEKMG
ncbi:hypothetical protein [Paraclostridium sp. AKS81]|uniref:hypothetical protein n=1 Tax=Paraclostridium sp. AKS81 TaxID=2876117 RepID=UPI0021E06B61|nr:hypothetical protein [Paraclostridium sp. AKS81]MCU9811839.1 hypothetical protein [Paraclostridium sp. AKS81]